MTEEADFLRAMEENPNDLALRMVFADWLEERGDHPLKGELLRLTHTLTQAIDVPQRANLEARFQALVRRLDVRFLSQLVNDMKSLLCDCEQRV
jgi:uncharacterized protein (TIGR02996 family)